MDTVLPSFSVYLLVYTVLVNAIFLIRPSPYGKFSIKWSGWNDRFSISNKFFKPLITIGFYTFFIGWIDEEWNYYNKWPSNTRGWLLLIWLNIYFGWRTFLSHLSINSISKIEELEGEKRVPIWLPIVYLLFFAPAGMFLREMCAKSTEDLKFYEYVLIFFAALAFVMNGHVDITMNINREKGKAYDYIGTYLCERQIFKLYDAMFFLYDYMMIPPNYAFDIIHWFFFLFVAYSWEGVWFVACIIVFLLVRGVGQKYWYRLKTEGAKCETSSSVVDENNPLIEKISF